MTADLVAACRASCSSSGNPAGVRGGLQSKLVQRNIIACATDGGGLRPE